MHGRRGLYSMFARIDGCDVSRLFSILDRAVRRAGSMRLEADAYARCIRGYWSGLPSSRQGGTSTCVQVQGAAVREKRSSFCFVRAFSDVAGASCFGAAICTP